MKEFWMVCAWDRYYPDSGVENIKFVCFDKEQAYEYLVKLKSKDYYDIYEVFSSNDLRWEIAE